MNDAIRMQLSAYVDGELPENEAELLLRRVSQDAALRREVAEYFAMSRLLRGEPGMADADRLHERVAAEIENRPATEMDDGDAGSGTRAGRPLAGFAIAAAVALLAIFALQQSNTIDTDIVEPEVAAQVDGVPDTALRAERNRQYFLNHANASSQLGANGMNSRLVTLRFRAEVVEESDTGTPDDDEAVEAVVQP